MVDKTSFTFAERADQSPAATISFVISFDPIPTQ